MSALQGFSHFKHFNVSSPAQYVAHVEINRPEKLNAFFEAMWLEIGQIFDLLSVNPDIRAVVLTGAGDRAFTAGLDVQAASESSLGTPPNVDGARAATKHRRHIFEFQECITRIEKCEKPVIAVLHGFSFGLALDMTACCDVRICAKDVKISVKEVDIGLAADIGTLARLPKIVGNLSWVKEVALSARVFGADEALSVGLVSQVHDTKAQAVEAAFKLASLISTKSPVAVQGTKELINHARDNTVADSLRYTAVWNAAMLQTGDIEAALLSSLKRTKPTFEKL